MLAVQLYLVVVTCSNQVSLLRNASIDAVVTEISGKANFETVTGEILDVPANRCRVGARWRRRVDMAELQEALAATQAASESWAID